MYLKWKDQLRRNNILKVLYNINKLFINNNVKIIFESKY